MEKPLNHDLTRPLGLTPERVAPPRACVILVPFATHIAPACEQGLIELQRRGYEVRRVGGYAAIDQGRNQMATDALTAGFEEHPTTLQRILDEQTSSWGGGRPLPELLDALERARAGRFVALVRASLG